MNDLSQQQLAQEVHTRPLRFVLAVTGGGSQAISTLLSEPGASRSILEATVPYAADALHAFLGSQPDEYCSDRTGRAMAMAAYRRAQTLDPRAKCCGIGCTASLVSDRPKRGSHRAHVAWQTASATTAFQLELTKGARSRAEEEAVVAALVLNAVAESCGAAARVDLNLLGDESVEVTRVDAPLDEQDLLAERIATAPRGSARRDAPPQALFPGAFNPLHQGHQKIVQVAQQQLGCDVAFEISMENVDKPPLDFIEIDRRLRQFKAGEAVWLTSAPTFVRKSELFPGCTFVIGVDTVERVGQQRYYGSEAAMLEAMEAMGDRGCRFLVFGRKMGDTFRTLDNLDLPEALARLCTAVPATEFREDISSTELRQQSRASQ